VTSLWSWVVASVEVARRRVVVWDLAPLSGGGMVLPPPEAFPLESR